jgi:tripartite-type tricarboxylate transporter receptor subunit TctC
MKIFKVSALLVCLGLTAASVMAQTTPTSKQTSSPTQITSQNSGFPNKPIYILVPYGAGSGGDLYSRFFGKKLSEILKVPVIVENKAGGGAPLLFKPLRPTRQMVTRYLWGATPLRQPMSQR